MAMTATAAPPVSPLDRRHQELAEFLARHGWAGAHFVPLSQDITVRQYFRVTHNGRHAVLMDAHTSLRREDVNVPGQPYAQKAGTSQDPMERTEDYVFMANKFRQLGFSTPEIYAAEHDKHLVLMEDMGDDKFFDLIQSGSKQPPELLTLAVDALIAKFHADPTIALDGCIAYADEYWLFRIEQFLKHYMPLVRKQPVTDTARAEYLGVFKAALDRAHVLPNILLHGDYGVQNLMYMAGRPGIKAVGMVDFQDMTDARGNMSGSPAFDLMFLIRDVRADFSDELMEQMRERFFQGSGLTDRVQFDYECSAIVAAQSAKCLGLFARFGIGNNRPEYLPFLANCWRHLRWALGHPDLAQVKRWFEQNGGLE